MKEIGQKFQKYGKLPLTQLTHQIKSLITDAPPTDLLLPQSSAKDEVFCKYLNNSTIYIFSQKSAGMELYRMLNYVKPDKIYLQLRSDDVNHKHPSFKVGPEEVIMSPVHYKDSESALKKSGLMISEKPIKVFGNKDLWRDRFGERAALFASIWAIQHDLDHLVLADIPRVALYRHLSHSLTLMQLQSMFSTICKTIGAKPDSFEVEDVQVPMTLAYRMYPEIWDKASVHHLAWVLLNDSKRKIKNKAEQVFFCVASRETGNRLEQVLTENLPEFKNDSSLFHSSIVRKESPEMVSEKLALLDVFSYGLNIIDKIAHHHASKRALEFIQEIVNIERQESNFRMAQREFDLRTDKLMKLYLSKMKMYSTMGNQKVEEGKNELKAEILKSVLKETT